MSDIDLEVELQKYLGGSVPQAPKELTAHDRLVLNNFFDTQPKKRAAYMEQLGFEMNPKNDNEFRQLGSSGGYVGKVDPNGFNPNEWKSIYAKGGISAVLNEMKADAKDVAFDLGFPAAMGLAAGGEAGGATVNPLVGIIAGIGTGMLAHASAESVKNAVANVYLNKNIPYDMKLGATQALLGGIFKGGMTGLAGVKQKVAQATIDKTLEGIENASQRFSSNKLTPTILKEAAQNPEMFSKEATQNAESVLASQYNKMFGLKAPNIDVEGGHEFVANRVKDIKPDSLFGKALQPLNQAADQEMNKLSQTPMANFKLADVLDSFQGVRSKIESTGISTAAEESGLGQLDRYQNQLLQMAKRNLKSQGVLNPTQDDLLKADLDFSQVRMLSKKMKDAAFDDQVHGSDLLAQVAGSGPGQLGSKLTQKADTLGYNWSQIQQQRHGILDLFNRAKNVLTPNSMDGAFLGNDSAKKNTVVGTLGELDNLFGTNVSEQAKTANYQRAFKQLYTNPNKTFGSGDVMKESLKAGTEGFMKGVGAGAAIGFPFHIAPITGAIGGIGYGLREASKGAKNAQLVNPAQSISDLLQQRLSSDKTYNSIMSGGSGIRNFVGNEAAIQGAKLAPSESPAPQSDQSNINLEAELQKYLQENGQ